jgi:hypothetical protein
MSVRVADRVDDWSQRPFDGGYADLHELADGEFSGVVHAGGAELYMTSGSVVGIEGGDIEDFESATGTTSEAPEPALPLLCVMEAADADVRAQYYTEDTPIADVDATLTDGGFTGYLELSENVLSGDYYLVYHGGTSMAVGFVGAAEQLIAGDEAFETADDEVGIFNVRQVDVEPIEIPEPAATEPAGAATEAGDPAAADEPPAETGEATTPEAREMASESDPDPEPAGSAGSGPATDEATEIAAAESPSADDRSGSHRSDPSADGTVEPTPGSGAAAPGADSTAAEGEAETGGRDGGRTDTAAGSAGGGGGRGTATAGSATGGGQEPRNAGASQAGDLETRAIPSLDPGRTQVPERQTGGGQSATRAEASGQQAHRGQSAGGRQREHSPETDPRDATPREPQAGETASAGAATDELEAELADREAAVERLEAELEEATEERDELEAELEAAIEERDELAAEVERLEDELAGLEDELGAATDAERRLSPSEAIEATNLFVDYDSKGAATLAMAHEGSVGVEEVAGNLQLGVHTEFEQAGVAVNGQEFDAFLRSTLQYRFAEWLIGSLLFEVRDTGHADALTDLYAAIPEIRRVEFDGAVDVEYVEDGQEKGGREHFDVIFRHRMGDPLVVANLNDARDPATGSMMETLVTAAERVGQTADSLAGAFLVTSSFFESEALETVSESTQGGLLSRDKRKSFVNLSRKRGYHLCLVAARDGNFHLEVPEL